jgi:predicted RNase H-like nuclease
VTGTHNPIQELLSADGLLQKLLLSGSESDRNAARDVIAQLITSNYGEYVFRLGAQPAREVILSGDFNDDVDGWIGAERTPEEIAILRDALNAVVEEIGGKVRMHSPVTE